MIIITVFEYMVKGKVTVLSQLVGRSHGKRRDV